VTDSRFYLRPLNVDSLVDHRAEAETPTPERYLTSVSIVGGIEMPLTIARIDIFIAAFPLRLSDPRRIIDIADVVVGWAMRELPSVYEFGILNAALDAFLGLDFRSHHAASILNN